MPALRFEYSDAVSLGSCGSTVATPRDDVTELATWTHGGEEIGPLAAPADLPENTVVNRSWALYVGSDAMQERIQRLLSYQRIKAQRAPRAVRNLALPEESTKRKPWRGAKEEKRNYEIMMNGCSLAGLQIRKGIDAYQIAYREALRRAEEDAAIAEEASAGKKKIKVVVNTKALPLQLIKTRRLEPLRAQLPSWNPEIIRRAMHEAQSAKMALLHREINSQIKERKQLDNHCRSAIGLQRKGPPVLTKIDFAKHFAKSEGLSYEEWIKQQELKQEQRNERDRHNLLQERKMAEFKVRDIRPTESELMQGQLALIEHRLGTDNNTSALQAAAARLRTCNRPWNRLFASLTTTMLGILRAQGMGLVYAAQDTMFIEPDLLLGTEELAGRKLRLLDLGVTHILRVSSSPDIKFPDEFVYCRLHITESPSERQDRLKSELDMGRRFISGALKLGGRVLVCCNDGASRAPAAIIAFLMWERSICLKSAYYYLLLHEPNVQVTPSLALCLSLIEIETFHYASVRGLKLFRNPTQREVAKQLGIPHHVPWSVSISILRGDLHIHDLYAFWNGKPRRPSKRSKQKNKRKKRSAPARDTTELSRRRKSSSLKLTVSGTLKSAGALLTKKRRAHTISPGTVAQRRHSNSL